MLELMCLCFFYYDFGASFRGENFFYIALFFKHSLNFVTFYLNNNCIIIIIIIIHYE